MSGCFPNLNTCDNALIPLRAMAVRDAVALTFRRKLVPNQEVSIGFQLEKDRSLVAFCELTCRIKCCPRRHRQSSD